MKYPPKTDEELDAMGIIPEGTKCRAEIVSAETYIGKESGKESIKTVIDIFHDGNTSQVWCFLTPNYARLWKHAILAVATQIEYESGEVGPELFSGKAVGVVVGIDEYKGKKKNIVTDFYKVEARHPGEDNPSDLPF